MKKKLLLAAIITVCGFTVYTSNKTNNSTKQFSEIVLANIEALTDGESQPNQCRWKRVKDDFGCVYHVCVVGGDGDLCTCGETKG